MIQLTLSSSFLSSSSVTEEISAINSILPEIETNRLSSKIPKIWINSKKQI